jgi:hypothetical protein
LTIPFNVLCEEKIYFYMKNAVFWDVAPCTSCVNRRFGGTYRLHLQGRKIRERGTSLSRWLLVPRSLIFLPLRCRRYVPLKRRFTQEIHGATSKKTTFFIVTAVKTSNLIYFYLFNKEEVRTYFIYRRFLYCTCYVM